MGSNILSSWYIVLNLRALLEVMVPRQIGMGREHDRGRELADREHRRRVQGAGVVGERVVKRETQNQVAGLRLFDAHAQRGQEGDFLQRLFEGD